MLVRATVDVTLRRTLFFDVQCGDDSFPSRVAQVIQEDVIAEGDTDVVFHSVSWEEVLEPVSDIRCGAGEGDTFCDKQSGHPGHTHYDSATGVGWTHTTEALA